MKKFYFLFCLLIVLCGCSSDDDVNQSGIPGGGQYDISFKYDNNEWYGTGGSAINDVDNQIESSFLLIVATSKGAGNQDPDFTSMISGLSLKDGYIITMRGGFNMGEYFEVKIDGVSFVTNNAPEDLEVGQLKITSYSSRIKGEFSGTLYAENGDTIEVTAGVFNFDVLHF